MMKLCVRVTCAWCNTILQEGSPGARVSHGICESCDRTLLRTVPDNLEQRIQQALGQA